MFKKQIIQLHREPIKPGETIAPHDSFCLQSEVSSLKELSALMDEVKDEYDWDGFQLTVHLENSPRFLMQAAE